MGITPTNWDRLQWSINLSVLYIFVGGNWGTQEKAIVTGRTCRLNLGCWRYEVLSPLAVEQCYHCVQDHFI